MTKLKKLRLEKRMTVTHLAKLTGIAQSSITEIENGKHEPTLSKAILLARAFEMPVEDLFDHICRSSQKKSTSKTAI